MADFATYAAAEIRAKAQVAAGTWVVAHVARATTGGKIVCRVIRPMSASAPDAGAWVEIDDDATD